jgi:hypothetical protein
MNVVIYRYTIRAMMIEIELWIHNWNKSINNEYVDLSYDYYWWIVYNPRIERILGIVNKWDY